MPAYLKMKGLLQKLFVYDEKKKKEALWHK